MKRYTKPSVEFRKRFLGAGKQRQHNVAAAAAGCERSPSDNSKTHSSGTQLSPTASRAMLMVSLTQPAATKDMQSQSSIATTASFQEEQVAALQLEQQLLHYPSTNAAAPRLLIRFPDPPINRELVTQFSPSIANVHFSTSCAPRYCFVQLHANADVQQTINTLNSTPFAGGFLQAELCHSQQANKSNNAKDVDPRTLYVRNLSSSLKAKQIKALFPGHQRVEISSSLNLKNRRFALVRYRSFAEAKQAFKQSVNRLIAGLSLQVRFQRFQSQQQLQQKKQQQQPKDSAETILYANSTLLEHSVQAAMHEANTLSSNMNENCLSSNVDTQNAHATAAAETPLVLEEEQDFFDFLDSHARVNSETKAIDFDDTNSDDFNIEHIVANQRVIEIDSTQDIKPFLGKCPLPDTSLYVADIRKQLKLNTTTDKTDKLDEIFAELEE